jgi:hypothetical protein
MESRLEDFMKESSEENGEDFTYYCPIGTVSDD